MTDTPADVAEALPPLPQCWTGSPVTVTWAEDGERTTREVYTAEQMAQYANAHAANLARQLAEARADVEVLVKLKQHEQDRAEQAEAKLAEANVDAARYGWMREWFMREGKRMEISPLGHMKRETADEIDAAIDAALQTGEVTR